MPVIPVYSQQVQKQDTPTTAPSFTAPAATAFGTDVTEAAIKAGAAAGAVGKILDTHIIDMQKREDNQQVIDTETKYRVDMQKLLYADERDKDNKPLGLLQRQGVYSKGVTVDFDANESKIRLKYAETLKSPDQINAFNNSAASHAISNRDMLIRHEAQQRKIGEESSLTAGLALSIMEVGKNAAPENITSLINGDNVKIANTLSDQAPDIIKLAQLQHGDKLAETALNVIYDKGDQIATKAALEKVKPSISNFLYTQFSEKIAEGGKLAQIHSVWGHVQGMANSDGLPDLGKMEEYVNTLKLQPEDYDKTLNYVQAKAGDMTRILNQQHMENDNAFMNQIYAGKNHGQGMDSALKLLDKYSRGAYDKELKRDIISKLYAPVAIKTDPGVYMALWKGVMGNSANGKDLDSAFRAGRISVSDYESLTKEAYNIKKDGVKQDAANAWDRIELLAEKTYPDSKDKPKKDAYLYEVKQKIQGQTSEDSFAIANRLLEHVTKVKRFWFDSTRSSWEVAAANRDKETLSYSKYSNDLGEPMLTAISHSMRAVNPNFKIENIKDFADNFGGYKNILPGSKVYQVMEGMLDKGQIVTVKNVKSMLQLNNIYKLPDKPAPPEPIAPYVAPVSMFPIQKMKDTPLEIPGVKAVGKIVHSVIELPAAIGKQNRAARIEYIRNHPDLMQKPELLKQYPELNSPRKGK